MTRSPSDTGNQVLKTWLLVAGLCGCLPEPSSVEVIEDDGAPEVVSNFSSVGEILQLGGEADNSQAQPVRACIGQEAGAEILPAVLELLIDTSGSMNQEPPRSRRSKWEQTRSALLDAIDLMPQSSAMGLVFYPDQQTERGRCFDREAEIGIRPLGEAGNRQRRRIEDAFLSQAPEGGTPTHDAYKFALSELDASDEPGRRFIVLMTDGQATFSEGCRGSGSIREPVDSGPLVPEAAQARRLGIRTFVVGSPGSEEARESLSRMAEAGGTAAAGCSHQGPNYCHFDMTQEEDLAQALRDAFAAIAGQALSCAIDIPAPPGGRALDLNQVNVLFTPESGADVEVLRQSDGGTCATGWQYSEDGSQVLLCGSTCDRVRNSTGELSLEFGCETELF